MFGPISISGPVIGPMFMGPISGPMFMDAIAGPIYPVWTGPIYPGVGRPAWVGGFVLCHFLRINKSDFNIR